MQELKQFIPKRNSVLTIKLFDYNGNIGLPLVFHSIPKSLNIDGIVQCIGKGCEFCELYNRLSNLGLYDSIKSYMKSNNNINLNLRKMSQYLIPVMVYNELYPKNSNYYIMRLWDNSVLKIMEYISKNDLYHISESSCMDMLRITVDQRNYITNIEYIDGGDIPFMSDKLFNFVKLLNIENIYNSVKLIHDIKHINTVYNMVYNIVKISYSEMKKRGYFNG